MDNKTASIMESRLPAHLTVEHYNPGDGRRYKIVPDNKSYFGCSGLTFSGRDEAMKGVLTYTQGFFDGMDAIAIHPVRICGDEVEEVLSFDKADAAAVYYSIPDGDLKHIADVRLEDGYVRISDLIYAMNLLRTYARRSM